jgi:Zn/Cd-binding protein ZinT
MNAKCLTVVMVFCFFTLQTAVSCQKDTPERKEDTAQEDPNVEGWFFRAISGYPVSVTFEPIVLYKDGEYVEVEDEPVDDLNKAVDKRERPKAWGTWRKEGDTYYLTNNEGRTADYQLGNGNWFPAYPYMKDVALASAYENTTGGDYSNGTSALFKTRIDFPQEGYFYHSFNGGVIAPGSAAWNKTEDAGTYTITDHTMVLTYNTGQVVRLSFAMGAKGNPAHPSSDMVFIGGDVFLGL